jgi:curved DNA-binding protein CbpA
VSDKECRRILNVPADASPETIRQAYLDLARVWHPDRFQSDERLRKIAEEHLCEVNAAYAG